MKNLQDLKPKTKTAVEKIIKKIASGTEINNLTEKEKEYFNDQELLTLIQQEVKNILEQQNKGEAIVDGIEDPETKAEGKEELREISEQVSEITESIGETKAETGLNQKTESLDEKIKTANSFDELYKIIEEIGGIQGTEYGTSEQIIPLIKNFVDGKAEINEITKGSGLRNKVLELVKVEEENEKNKEILREKQRLLPEFQTIPGSIEIANPKYKEGDVVFIKRSNGDIENDWVVSGTILRVDKNKNPIRAVVVGKKIENGDTIVKEFIESELDNLNKTITKEDEGLAEVQKKLNALEEKTANLRDKITQAEQQFAEKDREIAALEEAKKFESKNEEVLDIKNLILQKILEKEVAERRDLTEEEKKNLAREIFLEEKSKTKESKFNILDNKFTKWWNKDYNERTGKEKVVRAVASAGLIGLSIFGVGEYLNIKSESISGEARLARRVIFSGIASSLAVWASDKNFDLDFLNKSKEKFKSLSIYSKVGLGIVGAGSVVALSSLTTALIIGGGLAAKLSTSMVANLWIEEEKDKKERLKNSEKILDINEFIDKLPQIQKEFEKIDYSINRIKTAKSLASGLISNVTGVGVLASLSLGDLEEEPKNYSENKEASKVEEATQNTQKTKSENEGWLKKLFSKKENTETKTEEITKNKTVLKTEEVVENTDQQTPKTETIQNQENTLSEPEKTKNIVKNETPETETQGGKITNPQTPENKINIPKEAIIDGKERVGITYAFRDQLITNKGLANKLGIDHSKLDDAKYVAKEMKNLAIKFGYMDQEGHEIRISEDGKNQIAYILKLDSNGNPIVEETKLNGEILETHKQGESFEGKGYDKAYEDFEDKKYSYEKTNNTLEQGDNKTYPAPEKIINTEQGTSFNNFQHPPEFYTERELEEDLKLGINSGQNKITPDSLSKDEIQAPEKVFNVEKSPSWAGLEKANFLKFINIKDPNHTYSPEEFKIFKALEKEYVDALNKQANLKTYLENNKLSIKETKDLLHKINYENYKITTKTEDILDNQKTSDSLIEKIKGDKELQEINKVADKFDYEVTINDLKEVKKLGDQNINNLFGTEKNTWVKIKDVGATKYMKAISNDSLSDYLNKLKYLTGLKPKNGVWGTGLGKKEQIDDYINRCLLEAQKKGILSKVILEKNEDITPLPKSDTIIKGKTYFDDLYK